MTIEERHRYSALLWATEPTTEILRRKRFTRAEVDRLEDAGFFEWQRCELIGGDLTVTFGQSPQHAYASGNVGCWISHADAWWCSPDQMERPTAKCGY
jgi:hypothetical protein